MEKSVFELDLDQVRFHDFWTEMQTLIDPKQDAVVAYPICAACEDKILRAGNAQRPEKLDFLFF